MLRSLTLILPLTAAMYAPKLPPSAIPPSVIPASPVAPPVAPTKPTATTLLSNATVAALAKVPEAKLMPGIVLGPDTPIATDASIAFHCASWVQPRFEGQAANVLFHGRNECGGYGTFAMVWFKAQTDKQYVVECAGTSQKWRLIENTPNSVGQDTTFTGGTTRPWMIVRPLTAGWHGVQISAVVTDNESYTLTKCRVTPSAK